MDRSVPADVLDLDEKGLSGSESPWFGEVDQIDHGAARGQGYLVDHRGPPVIHGVGKNSTP